ncbi:MAG: hypothetical protein DWH98_04110 [Planctomycetota bacterium]|nr:MAG: hypothetical protein DWH98_04110 [Planctomycetota bacterium]
MLDVGVQWLGGSGGWAAVGSKRQWLRPSLAPSVLTNRLSGNWGTDSDWKWLPQIGRSLRPRCGQEWGILLQKEVTASIRLSNSGPNAACCD